MSIYKQTVVTLLSENILNKEDTILVIAGGTQDRDVFYEQGFTNVIISNIDHHAGISDYAPYEWIYQDAESVNYDDSSFDWVFIHAGLHHCGSPHNALCEMLRVSRKGIVVFEARDSILMRIAVRFGLGVDFELEPAAITSGKIGGYRNTNIPNYIYRWTEREVEKTVYSYAPSHKHKFRYFYHLDVPTQRLRMSPSLLKRIIGNSFSIITPLFEKSFPKQCNQFGFLVQKNQALQPWLLAENGTLSPNMEYLKENFNTENYYD